MSRGKVTRSESGARIAAIGRAFPSHYYPQEALLEALRGVWAEEHHNPDRLERLHRNVQVGGRHLALPLEDYPRLEGFGQANDAWIRVGREVGAAAMRDGLDLAGLAAGDVDALFTVTVTGVATPSLDARLVNDLGLRPDVKRVPVFGLGCVAGAAGIARAADYVRGFPGHVAVLLSVELCSLTVQRRDLSIPNLIATGLFGDGAAAVVVAGADVRLGSDDGGGEDAARPRVVATRSSFYPDTEDVMGWEITEDGFGIVLSAEVPQMVTERLAPDVDAFLADHDLARRDVSHWICHPGGPKVLEAMEAALELPRSALALTWKSLEDVGNLSSTSVLLVLRDTLEERRPAPGEWGVLLAMGPGFCSELVLLRF